MMLWIWMSGLVHAEPVLEGVFSLDESAEAVTSKHAAAVDAGVASLPWAIRPFARPKLESAVRNCSKVEVSLDATAFVSRCDSDKGFHQPRGEPGTMTGDDGKTYGVALDVGSDRVMLSFSGEEGGQRSIFLPQPDGSLLLTKEIFSKWLPAPIVWTVRYTRQ